MRAPTNWALARTSGAGRSRGTKAPGRAVATFQIRALRWLPSTTTSRLPSGLNAAVVTVSVAFPYCFTSPVWVSQTTAPPFAFAPATRRPLRLQGEQPTARPQGHDPTSVSRMPPLRGTITPVFVFQTARRSPWTTSTSREFGLKAALSARRQVGSIGVSGRAGHSRALPSSDPGGDLRPVRAEPGSDDAVRVPAKH